MHKLAIPPDFLAQNCKVVAIAINTVKVSIASSRRGLFSAGYFLLKEQSLFETDFCIQISIEQKIKIAKHVVNRFA